VSKSICGRACVPKQKITGLMDFSNNFAERSLGQAVLPCTLQFSFWDLPFLGLAFRGISVAVFVFLFSDVNVCLNAVDSWSGTFL
jgi:hypothetical protein